MARNRKAEEESATPFRVLAEAEPVLRVGVREFRERFKEACEANVPMVVTRGRSEVAVFIPLEIPFWRSAEDMHRARKTLTQAVEKIKRRLQI